jgi:hypothetical protein
MATTYSTRFYNSDGTIKPGIVPFGATGHPSFEEFNETIATTVTDGLDEHYLMPLPFTGNRRLLGLWITAGDMDTGTPALDADIVYRYTLNAVVQTDVVVYDSSVAGLFSAAIAMKWHPKRLTLPAADDARGHLIFKVGVAAATPAAANLTVIPFWV